MRVGASLEMISLLKVSCLVKQSNLLRPTVVARIRRDSVILSVILSTCPHDKTKTDESTYLLTSGCRVLCTLHILQCCTHKFTLETV